ncbi:MAG: hypothetical protein GY942_09775, partial [Aestuariibacter sp.]|nr:hypothetical protein [Aestuariibacter sp.]
CQGQACAGTGKHHAAGNHSLSPIRNWFCIIEFFETTLRYHMLKRFFVLAGVMLAILSPATAGQDIYLEWFKPANAHIRTAASYLRTGNIDFAALALEELIESGMNEGPDNALSKISVSTIQTVEKALAQIDANEPKSARQTLLDLRQMLFVAHRKNNVTVFDDCVWSLVQKGKA